MRRHDHDAGTEESLRPKSARIDESDQPLMTKAAAQGRWDVVDPDHVTRLQRTAGNAAVTEAMSEQSEERSPVHDVITSGNGRPLEPEIRSDMESRLGQDFGDVRVHEDDRAHQSAKAVNAHAYTVGSNMVFQRDRFDPSTDQGRVTLAHELTHVVQQRSGPVDGTPAAGGIRVSDPGDRFEREAAATAERAMSGPAPQPMAAAPTAPAIQRQAESEEEEDVQGLFVKGEQPGPAGSALQRQEEPEEEEAT